MLMYVDGELVDMPEEQAATLPAPGGLAAQARTYKSDVWRRCTDAEAAILDAALAAAPVKMRRLWADSTILEHESPEFAAVLVPMQEAFGEDRAAEILAPST